MKRGERKYTGVLQYFHNYEHDPEGRTHCMGPLSNPYIIVHYQGKHVINTQFAVGHDRKRERTWFQFLDRLGPGWDLASGLEIDKDDVPSKIKTVRNEIFEEQRLKQERLKRRLGH
jgi:hypothetical protein